MRRARQGLDERRYRREGKKLAAVARAFANARAPAEPEEESFGGLAIIGLTDEQVAAYRAHRAERAAESEDVEVLTDNWHAAQVFQRCGWQMVGGGMGRPLYVGIAAAEIQATARALRVRFDVDLLDDVRAIASTVREIWNSKRS